MFSRILATARPAVPTSQAGGNIDTSSTARLPSSSLRWASMTVRMYAASALPRESMTRLADRVELDADLLDVLRGEVGDRVVGLLLHDGHGCPLVSDQCGQWSMSHAPAAAEMQVWMGRRRPGAAVVISPLRRSRTAPSRRGRTQPKQMPIRHPDGISTPAASAGVEDRGGAIRLDGRAGAGKAHGAAVAHDQGRGPEPLGEQVESALVVVLLEGVEQTGGSARERGSLLQVGDEALEVGDVEDAVGRRSARRAGSVQPRREPASWRRRWSRARRSDMHDDDVVGL